MTERSTNSKNSTNKNNNNDDDHNENPNNNNNKNDQKQQDAAPGAAPDFRQNHRRPPTTPAHLPPQPHELTAEWTVRAQLTFARAGERVQREFSTNDPVNPVRVVYKWSTLDSNSENVRDGGIVILDEDEDDNVDNDDDDEEEEDATSSNTLQSNKRTSSGRCSGQSTPLKPTRKQQQQQQQHTQQQRHESFRSTTSSTYAGGDLGGGDSAFSGSNTSKKPHKDTKSAHAAPGTATGGGALYGTRCRSTCNIVVSAVADFLPADAAAATAENFTTTDFIPEEEPDPFVYNTTASYTVLPQKSFDDSASNASKNLTSFGKILALRDAFCQTSDTETKYFEEHKRRYSNSRSPLERHAQQDEPPHRRSHLQRKPYEQRRATTEALLQPTNTNAAAYVADEGDTFMPSYTPSPTHTFKSASLPRIPPLPGQHYPTTSLYNKAQQPQQPQKSSSIGAAAEPQKKPRTVHIDVYCTGSDDDDDDQADGESSSSDASKDVADAGDQHELESNSTPQTVLNNEQMLLRHQRVTGQALPRRIAQKHTQKQMSNQNKTISNVSSQSDLNLGHAITKSSTAEEVCESKQLLFRKHIGDQRAAKLQNLRQKYMRQPSDDALSSNYPNSSRSTVRDATCSSISSAVPSSHADYAESSWKETEEPDDNISCSLAKSDSFEYENSVDRLRIKHMERFWSNRTGFVASSPDERPAHSPTRSHTQPTILHPISEGNSHSNSPFTPPQFQRNDTLPSESENFSETDVFYTYPGPGRHVQPFAPHSPTPNQHAMQLAQTPHLMRHRPGFLQFFGPPTPSPEPHPTQANNTAQPTSAPVQSSQAHLLYPNYAQHLQRWKSETRDDLSDKAPSPSAPSTQRNSPQSMHLTASSSATPQRCGSEAPPSSSLSSVLQSPMVARRFDMKQPSPSVSEASTVVSGYTSEYLEKARKFGKVVSTTRKPGHHVGPTKNPNCLCESCQRWMAERFQLRGRAFSLGERPVLKRPE